jgi:abequosyltransferase
MSKLSICIPTYNRSALLRECVTSILASAEGQNGNIEIVISDNASPDDTPAVVAELQERYPWIRYHRNDTNIGERNFYQVAGMASGDYLWIFSDDDKMTPDAIPTVMNYIRAGHELIVANYSVWSRDFSFVKVPSRCGISRNLVFANPDELMKRLAEKVTFISCLVMKKSLFFSVDSDKRDSFIPYGHSFMYIVYAAAAQCRRVAYHGTPLVKCRGDNSAADPETWNRVFIVGPAVAFETLAACGYSRQAIHAAKKSVLVDLIVPNTLWRKREGVGTRGLFGVVWPYYRNQASFWLLFAPALLVPRFVPQWLTRIVRIARPILYRHVE